MFKTVLKVKNYCVCDFIDHLQDLLGYLNTCVATYIYYTTLLNGAPGQ